MRSILITAIATALLTSAGSATAQYNSKGLEYIKSKGQIIGARLDTIQIPQTERYNCGAATAACILARESRKRTGSFYRFGVDDTYAFMNNGETDSGLTADEFKAGLPYVASMLRKALAKQSVTVKYDFSYMEQSSAKGDFTSAISDIAVRLLRTNSMAVIYGNSKINPDPGSHYYAVRGYVMSTLSDGTTSNGLFINDSIYNSGKFPFVKGLKPTTIVYEDTLKEIWKPTGFRGRKNDRHFYMVNQGN